MARISSGMASLPRSWSRLAVRIRSSSPSGRSIARASATDASAISVEGLPAHDGLAGERPQERVLGGGHRLATHVERPVARLGSGSARGGPCPSSPVSRNT